MAESPRMNKEPEFLAAKLRRVQDPHVRPLNGLVERWRQAGRQVPYADPDSGGVRSRILFLHESPGPRASPGHGSGLISTDNDDRQRGAVLAAEPGSRAVQGRLHQLERRHWYVSATARNVNAKDADGQAALSYLHEFVTLLTELRVVVVMGSFAGRWWFRYLICYPGSRVLPLLGAPHTSNRARISRPGFENDILVAMVKAKQVAWNHRP